MFIKLSDKSFIKRKPNSYSYSFFKSGIRNSLEINESAYSILELCNGEHSVEDIILLLSKKYNLDDTSVRKNVENFINLLSKDGLVDYLETPEHHEFTKGSPNIYYPDIMILEITDYCPLRCRHCYLGDKNQSLYIYEDIEKIFKCVDDSGVFQVQITGGEALTHPYFKDILNGLIDRGIIVSVSTSGMILNDKILNCLCRLKEVFGSFVRVSLDGNEATHNYIRKNSSSYVNAINFIKEIVKNKIPCQVGTVIINQTKSEIEDLVSTVKSIGVLLIEIGLLFETGDALKNNLTSSLKIIDYKSFLVNLSKKYSDDKFMIKLPCDSEKKNCGAGSKIIRIKSDMSVTPCPTVNLTLGNLKRQPFSEIMLCCGNLFHDFVSPCKEFCDGCENENICKNCMAQGLSLKNKVKDCKWFEKQKMILKQFTSN